MSTKGQLCFKYNGSALCYKYGGSALIFKGEKIAECTINVAFGKQSWVCNTYDCYHTIQYSCSGSGLTIKSSEQGMDSASFTVQPTASGTFTVSVTASTSCGAIDQENPGATCTVSAAQQGASPKIKTNQSLSPNTAKSFTIRFDSSGKLSSIS